MAFLVTVFWCLTCKKQIKMYKLRFIIDTATEQINLLKEIAVKAGLPFCFKKTRSIHGKHFLRL